MAISAFLMEVLHDGGKTLQDMIRVAEAMERGPDAHTIHTMVDRLLDVDCPAEAMAIAICEVADKINETNAATVVRLARVRDEHTQAKDSNRSRRGMRDSEWRELRLKIFERDSHQCQYCGAADDLTCDHIVPLVRGGTNDNENLTTACRSCNSSKGDKLVDEWRRQWA